MTGDLGLLAHTPPSVLSTGGGQGPPCAGSHSCTGTYKFLKVLSEQTNTAPASVASSPHLLPSRLELAHQAAHHGPVREPGGCSPPGAGRDSVRSHAASLPAVLRISALKCPIAEVVLDTQTPGPSAGADHVLEEQGRRKRATSSPRSARQGQRVATRHEAEQ